MKQNEGSTDRVIRVIIGVIAFAAGRFLFSGTFSTILYIIGAITLITGMAGYCGLYAILGISTKNTK